MEHIDLQLECLLLSKAWQIDYYQDRANGIIESSYFLIIWAEQFPVVSLLSPLFVKGLTTRNFTQYKTNPFFYRDKQNSPIIQSTLTLVAIKP